MAAGQSILEGRLGEMLAAPGVTIVDDSTVPGAYGSFKYDSEGTPGSRRVIIERGKLVGYLHSLETAGKFGVAPNGAARAEGYDAKPIVRMSNTAIEPGDWSLADMLAGTERGLYLSGGAWGYVYTAAGQFTCNVEEAFLIEKGELTTHFRNVCISGMTLETLQNVWAVGRDLRFELGGTCGKDGQGVPVADAQPTLRIPEIVVGGRV